MEKENRLVKKYGSEKAVNKFLLIIITIIDMFLFFGYIGDYTQGNIGFGFMLAVDLSVIVSMAACFFVYFRKKDSAVFKYVSVAGYMVVYALAVFGAQNDLVCMMVFPLTVIYILYYDFKLILGIAVYRRGAWAYAFGCAVKYLIISAAGRVNYCVPDRALRHDTDFK